MMERTPSRLEVAPGVFLDAISTPAQCDEILDDVASTIASIESQIEHAKADRSTIDPVWLAKANHALRVKKLCLPRLQQIRAQFSRDEKAKAHAELLKQQHTGDRAILRVVKEIAPEIAAKAWDLARARHPDLFPDGQAGAS